MLLLCTPLVVSTSQVVDPAPVSAELADGAVCEPGAQAPLQIQAAAQQRARVARQKAVRRIAEGERPAGRDVIVLNGQGYNYAAGRDPRVEEIQRRLFEEQGER
jgi:hypothetical protein